MLTVTRQMVVLLSTVTFLGLATAFFVHTTHSIAANDSLPTSPDKDTSAIVPPRDSFETLPPFQWTSFDADLNTSIEIEVKAASDAGYNLGMQADRLKRSEQMRIAEITAVTRAAEFFAYKVTRAVATSIDFIRRNAANLQAADEISLRPASREILKREQRARYELKGYVSYANDAKEIAMKAYLDVFNGKKLIYSTDIDVLSDSDLAHMFSSATVDQYFKAGRISAQRQALLTSTSGIVLDDCFDIDFRSLGDESILSSVCRGVWRSTFREICASTAGVEWESLNLRYSELREYWNRNKSIWQWLKRLDMVVDYVNLITKELSERATGDNAIGTWDCGTRRRGTPFWPWQK
jgi:hypothetical protein